MASSACISSTSIYHYLKDNLSSGADVYLASDANISSLVTQRWNVFEAPSYVVYARPATAEDVQTIVSVDRGQDLIGPFKLTGLSPDQVCVRREHPLPGNRRRERIHRLRATATGRHRHRPWPF